MPRRQALLARSPGSLPNCSTAASTFPRYPARTLSPTPRSCGVPVDDPTRTRRPFRALSANPLRANTTLSMRTLCSTGCTPASRLKSGDATRATFAHVGLSPTCPRPWNQICSRARGLYTPPLSFPTPLSVRGRNGAFSSATALGCQRRNPQAGSLEVLRPKKCSICFSASR